MKEYVILTDANCDFPESYLIKHKKDIDMIGLSYIIDSKQYTMNTENDLNIKDFYNKLRNGSISKSAMISYSQAKDFLSKYLEKGFDILFISFSAALSGSYNSFIMAASDLKSDFPEQNVLIMDSKSASLGQGLLVDCALKLKADGLSINEVYDFLQNNVQKFCHYFTVDDLNHLYRGGRVSKLTAVLGTMLGIKPILYVNSAGQLIPIGKVRGRKQSLDALVNKMSEKIGDNKNDVVFISHGDCEEDAEYVADLVRQRFGINNIMIGPVGPVIGTHSGPGTVALFFIGNDRIEKHL